MAEQVQEKRTRKEVSTKKDFVKAFTANVKAQTGERISQEKAWQIFKIAMASAFEVAAAKQLSLSGVGVFRVISSKRSEEVGKPALRMRFRASHVVDKALNEGVPFLDALVVRGVTEEEEGEGAEETAPETAEAPATAGAPVAEDVL